AEQSEVDLSILIQTPGEHHHETQRDPGNGSRFFIKRQHLKMRNPTIALDVLKGRHGFLVSILTIGVS
ncbi:MAG: hypothetical protein ACI4UT_04700, partial [Candidatus Enteromonas sp.]